MKYFYINNIKYNYNLEFTQNNYWKYNVPLIEYCETLGIIIPHYCYHKNLSIAGNCRMCLVELKNSPKPIVSCALSARSCLNNGEIYTNSPLVKKARENILEFLLLNHPLDCPICDQGGECDLQDQSLFFGFSRKRFYNFKRIVTDKNIGPIVKTVMTRCIHCTRCVRFASEIAGVEDLGMFGRGLNSEIGTYVEKVFQSELSGNIIDLCPVGALTSKPYPFVGRNWELKNLNTIDFSDGFASDIQLFLKNNKIIKVLPGYNKNDNSINWISDKTRFSFDGMFSPERITNTCIKNKNNKLILSLTWKFLFKELVNILYFYDHLSKHLIKINSIILILGNNITIESYALLKIISKKYSFLKLRKSECLNLLNDLESDFLITSIKNKTKLIKSNLCLCLGINTRYEGSNLNLKLRQRYLKGNFKIFSLSSIIDLTFPVSYIGSNIMLLKSITEGNNIFCQEIMNSFRPILICSSELFKRNDSKNLIGFLKLLKLNTNFLTSNWNGINFLNNSISSVGLLTLTSIKTIHKTDLKNAIGFYLINTSLDTVKLNNLIEFKLFNFFKEEGKNSKVFIEQNNLTNNKLYKIFEKNFKIYNYIYLPNNVFFETAGTFINTEGIYKKSIKVVSTTQQSKDNWQILRKFFSYSKTINFIGNSKFNKRIYFNCNNIFNFKNFIGFQYYAIKTLTNFAFFFNKKNCNINFLLVTKYKLKQKKLFKTKFQLWLDDFYINGKDYYSKQSFVMIECSKLFRLNKTNFI